MECSFMKFIFLHIMLLIFEFILMLIGLVTLFIDGLLLAIVSSKVVLWSPREAKHNMLWLVLVLKQNIKLLLTLLLNYYGFVGYFRILVFQLLFKLQFTIQIAHNNVFHEPTTHIEFDCHFAHHHLEVSYLQHQSISLVTTWHTCLPNHCLPFISTSYFPILSWSPHIHFKFDAECYINYSISHILNIGYYVINMFV